MLLFKTAAPVDRRSIKHQKVLKRNVSRKLCFNLLMESETAQSKDVYIKLWLFHSRESQIFILRKAVYVFLHSSQLRPHRMYISDLVIML